MPDVGPGSRTLKIQPRWIRGGVPFAALVVLYVTAVLWQPGQWLDGHIFSAAQRWAVGPLDRWIPFVGRRLLPVLLAAGVTVAALRALARRQVRPVVVAAAVVLLSTVISPWLRDELLWRPLYANGHGHGYNTFPSTHVALVTSLVVAIWILVPLSTQWLRLLPVIVLAAMVGSVVGHAHLPSDTIGSVLLVGVVQGLVGPPHRTRLAVDGR